MKNKQAYPLTFDERFMEHEYDAAISENHAAPISLYCSNCGHSLGYPPMLEEVCLECGSVVDLTKLQIPEWGFSWQK